MNRFLFFLLICLSFGAFAQLNSLGVKPTASGLFIHTDKTIYLNNETIWFGAYLLDKTEDQKLHRLLNVVISGADSGNILLDEKYPMDYGISIGKIILPDSIKGGVFKLIAFTDLLDSAYKPAVYFSATLTIGNQKLIITPSPLVKPSKNQLDSPKIQYVKAQLSTDRQEYGKRESVTIRVKLPDQGLFSVATVYSARLNNDQQRIMDVVSNPIERISNYKQQPLILNVRLRNKPLDKAVDVVVFGNNGLKMLSTDKTGQLNLQRDELLSPYGKKIAIMVGRQNAKDYQIELHNPMLQTAALLARENIISPEQLIMRQHNRQPISQNLTEKTVELNTVTIKGRTSNASTSKGKPGINDCGDWVDEYDYLNYPYSEKRYHPVIGKVYKKRIDIDPIARSFKVEPVYYTGCEASTQKNATLVQGVNLEAPFYGLDKSSTQPQYLTTLFWGAGLLSNANGEAEFTFSTADLSGEYRIILQGITANGDCYGEVIFVVK